MTKDNTKDELQQQAQTIEQEIKKIEAIIKASDTSTFEIIIQDIKNEMLNNVQGEDWKPLKQNKTKIEQFRNIVKILQNQDELLEQKKKNLKRYFGKLNIFN